jgi:hypothetical protein
VVRTKSEIRMRIVSLPKLDSASAGVNTLGTARASSTMSPTTSTERTSEAKRTSATTRSART